MSADPMIRAEKAVAFSQIAARRGGVMTIDADGYFELFESGLSRTEVHQAITDLVAAGTAVMASRLGRIRIFVNDIVES